MFALYKKIKTMYYFLIVIGGYLLLFILWSPYENPRYLLPLYPLILFFIFCGVIEMQKFIEKLFKINTKNIVIILFSLFLIAESVIVAVPIIKTYNLLNHTSINEGPNTLEVQEAFAYIYSNVPKNQTVSFRYPGYISMYTGRRDYGDPHWDGSVIYNESMSQNIRYVLLKKDDEDYGRFNQSLKNGPRFLPIFENNKYILFERT
jgi:hypothetical protein